MCAFVRAVHIFIVLQWATVGHAAASHQVEGCPPLLDNLCRYVCGQGVRLGRMGVVLDLPPGKQTQQ